MCSYFFFSKACDLLSVGLPITRVGWREVEFLMVQEGRVQKFNGSSYEDYVLTQDDLVSVVWSQFHEQVVA